MPLWPSVLALVILGERVQTYAGGLHRGGSVQSELLELPGQRVDQAALVIVQLVQTTRILSHLLVTLDDVVNGTVEHDQSRGI